jgi:hypothetical protein
LTIAMGFAAYRPCWAAQYGIVVLCALNFLDYIQIANDAHQLAAYE